MNIFLHIFGAHDNGTYRNDKRRFALERDSALQAARDQFDEPIWRLIEQLEGTLNEFSRVKHIDISDPRAVGSALNCALPDAAEMADIETEGLSVVHVKDGQSNKITGTINVGDKSYDVSFELHLSGPRGGTSKNAHQFVGKDIEGEPCLPGFDIEAPQGLLFFVACHLSGTGVSVSKAFIRFADGVDKKMIEIHRPVKSAAADATPATSPPGGGFKLKKDLKEKHGHASNQRRDAASSSKQTS